MPTMSDKGSEIIRQITESSEKAVLLCAPAGGGKTFAVMEIFSRSPHNICIITPNTHSAAQLTDELLTHNESGVLVGAKIWTMTTLASAILGSLDSRAAVISPLHRNLMLMEIIETLGSENRLSTLARLVDTPGLVSAIDKTIAELKRCAVDPAVLKTALPATQSKYSDLQNIYAHYQASLLELNQFDVEGITWQVRDELTGIPAEHDIGLGDIDTIIVDGFIDFTPTQLEILKLLADRGKKLILTLPLANDGRDELWHWPGRTRNAIEKTFDDQLQTIQLPFEPSTGLTAAGEILFDFTGKTTTPPKESKIVSTCGKDQEISQAVAEIKKLLLAGTAPNSIAILARNIDEYRDIIEKHFSAADIPLAVQCPTLDACPPVRFCLDIAQLPGENFESSAVLQIIKSSYFSPTALGEFDTDTVIAAKTAIRRCNVSQGRESYLTACDILAEQAFNAQNIDDDDYNSPLPKALADQPELFVKAREFFDAFFDLASRTATADKLAQLPCKLQLHKKICETSPAKLAARDLRSLATLETTLNSLDAFLSIDKLAPLLVNVAISATRQENVVDVLNILDARAMRWDHVFLVGCSEGQFPPKFSESSLMSEAQRENLHRLGLAIDRRSDLLAREMILFYLAVTRSEKSLTMSYLSSDSAGKARFPGSFIEAYIENTGGLDEWQHAGRFRQLKPVNDLLALDKIYSTAQASQACAYALFTQDPTRAIPWCGDENSARRFARGTWTMAQRWRGESYSSYDGTLSDPKILAELENDIPAKIVFSASRLSTFGQCPWKFFAKYHLGLEPLDQPEKQLQPAQAGLFCHEVLYQTFSSLAQTQPRPLDIRAVDEATLKNTFEDAFAAHAKTIEHQDMLYPTLWELQKQSLHDMLWDYLQGQVDLRESLDFRSLNFELGFGQNISRGSCDASSQAEPVEIEVGQTSIKFQGRIDRVDEIIHDNTTELAVVDYKTGHTPGMAESISGSNLQMPLYIKALEKLTGQPCMGGYFHGLANGKISGFARVAKSYGRWKTREDFDETARAIDEMIEGFLNRMQRGDYQLAPLKGSCSYCPYRQACHYAPARHSLYSQITPDDDE